MEDAVKAVNRERRKNSQTNKLNCHLKKLGGKKAKKYTKS